jgi:uncharacterized protein
VNPTNNPLRINVGFLINQPIGTSRDIHFDYPTMRIAPDFTVSNFVGMLRVTRTPQGILAQAAFRAEVLSECVRCLAEFVQPISTKFNELYAFNYKTITDSNLILSEDGNINLAPLLREYMLIEMPINTLCKPECKGLCLVCGEDLNVTSCEHVLNKAV